METQNSEVQAAIAAAQDRLSRLHEYPQFNTIDGYLSIKKSEVQATKDRLSAAGGNSPVMIMYGQDPAYIEEAINRLKSGDNAMAISILDNDIAQQTKNSSYSQKELPPEGSGDQKEYERLSQVIAKGKKVLDRTIDIDSVGWIEQQIAEAIKNRDSTKTGLAKIEMNRAGILIEQLSRLRSTLG